MSVVVYVLTVLAAVDVALTRLRFRGGVTSGRLQVPPGLVNVHTGAGTVAILLWVAFLASGWGERSGSALMGVVALAFFWVTTVAGLAILARWIPSRGKRARNDPVMDSWATKRGLGRLAGTPLLSVVAHVGMLLGVLVLTYAYLDRWV